MLWSYWIDVGGTFTDCVARCPDGAITASKVLSSGLFRGRVAKGLAREIILDQSPGKELEGFFEGYLLTLPLSGQKVKVSRFHADKQLLVLESAISVLPKSGEPYELQSPEPSPLVAIRRLRGLKLSEQIGPCRVRLGSTKGTNALLERKGADSAFLVTRGFADLLEIGYQNRPKLFDLNIKKAKPLPKFVREIEERLSARGEILIPLDEGKAWGLLGELKSLGIQSLGICLMHACQNSVHEKRLFELAKDAGFNHVSVSHQLSQLSKFVVRGDTTSLDAYLTPVLKDYLEQIRAGLPEADMKIMTSFGGLCEMDGFSGKDCILSGPAGGAVGAACAGERAGFSKVIGFDMGGTSTDVCRYDGRHAYRHEMEIKDSASDTVLRIAAPMLNIETVAAGGGSICWFDGQKARVGPESAGSKPGPACYGAGGPLTITDMNVLLGRILPDRFAFSLDETAVIKKMRAMLEEIRSRGVSFTVEQLAEGFIKIANATMASAIRKNTVAQGHDPRDHALVCFGGAGAQHACAVADELGISTIIIHPWAGVQSAWGLGLAARKAQTERSLCRVLTPALADSLKYMAGEMEISLREKLPAEDGETELASEYSVEMKYSGQDSGLLVITKDFADLHDTFQTLHNSRFGFQLSGREIELQMLRVEVAIKPRDVGSNQAKKTEDMKSQIPKASGFRKVCLNGAWMKVPFYERADLHSGQQIKGPAIIAEAFSTILLEPFWSLRVLENLELILEANAETRSGKMPSNLSFDPVTLELFWNRFSGIAAEMGEALRFSAVSTNVKERLDYSCAIFTKDGDLVVNAPHIPVHLGAMSQCVKALMVRHPGIRAGDAFVTNDPYQGGSHLPDVTVITPVFSRDGRRHLFFTANRAHHAEIGGSMPGSMPPFSKNLAEEGVVIPFFQLLDRNQTHEDELEKLLRGGPYPSRAVAENLADIRAQLAANQTGLFRLLELCDLHGEDIVGSFMSALRDVAEEKMRSALAGIPEGEYEIKDRMDDGAELKLRIHVEHESRKGRRAGKALLDFGGTCATRPNNLNANSAIVSSAVMYSFRCLIGEDIPLNSGVLLPLRILIPEHCMLNPIPSADPSKSPAVGGGNVETSQRLVDMIFAALKLTANSHGSMNNLLFGKSSDGKSKGWGYYETLGGGAGAGPDFDGAHALHTHMTNTRITDPEVLEQRYPVRLWRFCRRRNSGGLGFHKGGDGLTREMEFLEKLSVSILSSRRNTAPCGIEGGADAKAGQNLLLREGAESPDVLGWAAAFDVGPGDRIIIHTPGGGGYGKCGNDFQQTKEFEDDSQRQR